MKTIKTIFAGALAAAMSCSLCIPASAAEKPLKLTTAAAPFDYYHGSIGEGMHAISDSESDKMISISADDIAAFQENGELSYNVIVDDFAAFFDGAEGYAWYGDQDFRNGYAQFIKTDGNNEVLSKCIVHFDGEELSVIDEFTNYRSVSPNGYICSNEWGPRSGELTIYLTAPDGEVNTLVLNNADYICGFRDDGTDISVLTYTVLEENWEGTNWTRLECSLNIIDENGNIETVSIGETNGTPVAFEHGENYDFFAVYRLAPTAATPRVYLHDSGEIVEIDTLSITAAAKEVNESCFISGSSFCNFGKRVYDGILSAAIEVNSETCWVLVDLNNGGKAVSGVYKSINTYDGEIYLVQDFDGRWGYINNDGEELGMFDDAGAFIGEYAPVIKKGKAYLVDRDMNIVSNGVKADSVITMDDGLYNYTVNDKTYLMTYTLSEEAAEEQPAVEETIEDEPVINETAEEEPVIEDTAEAAPVVDTAPAVDTDAPADTDSKGGSPDTGANGIAATAAVSVIALGAVLLSRKRS